MNTIKLNTIGERPIKKGGGGGNYVYYSGTMRDFSEFLSLASMAKVAADSGIIYYPMGMALYPDTFTSETNIIGAGFDLSMKISHPASGELTTVGDVLAEFGVDWTQITEEEFYALPQPKNHSISGEIYVSNNECTFGYNMYTGGFYMPKGSTLVVNGNEVEKTNYNEYRYNVYEADGWYPFELKFTQAVTNLDRFGMGDSFNGGVTNLRNLDFSNFDASAVTSIGQGAFSFGGDVLPQTLDLSMCNFENVETISAFGATSYEKESSFTLKLDGYMPKLWDWSISYLEGVTATLMYKKENEQYITPYKDDLISYGWTLVPF